MSISAQCLLRLWSSRLVNIVKIKWMRSGVKIRKRNYLISMLKACADIEFFSVGGGVGGCIFSCRGGGKFTM